MALFNYATKEITLKIVYYGPGLSGKTTNLQHLHSSLNASSKGKLLSLSTEADRTLFFDFLPIELGKIKDFSVRFQLYTVPGQVRYNATRRIVLKGADAVIFVADSQREMREQNVESIENMRENLLANNIDPEDIPIVFQYNKRDLKDTASIEELDRDLNTQSRPVVEGIAIDGTGVEEAFKLISRLLLQHISKKHKIEIEPLEEKKETPPPQPSFFSTPDSEKSDQAASVIPSAHRSVVLKNKPQDRQEGTIPLQKSAGAELGAWQETAESGRKGSNLTAPSQESIDRLIGEVQRINGILESLKNSFSGMKDEMKGLSEMKKTQEETNNILRDLKDVFAGLKTRRRWFRF
jgi:small GTP-binding protein